MTRYKLLSFVILWSMVISINAQKVKVTSSNDKTIVYSKGSTSIEETEIKGIQIGGGFSYGFFYPIDVNEYIENMYTNYITTNTEIYMNFSFRLVAGVMVNKNIGVRGQLSASFAPKVVVGADDFYSLNRYAPGAGMDFFIPLDNNANSLFGGITADLSFMSFEGYKSTGIGYQLRGGMRWAGTGNGFFDFFGAIDLAKHKTNALELPYLSYNGVQLGVTAYLNLTK